MEKKIVSSQSRHKKLSPIALKQSSENKKTQSKTAKTKVNDVKSKLDKKVDVTGQKTVTYIRKISRPCRADIKEKNDKIGENKAISDDKTNKFVKPTKDEFNKFYKNLLAFDSVPDSDSLESDYDEERGFTTADRFLMLNQLSKELERREHVIKDVRKQKSDELLKAQKSERDIGIEFAAYDDEINKIIKKYFKDTEDENSLQNIPKEIRKERTSTKKVTDILKKENSLESDDSYDAENLKLEVKKLMETLDKRVKDYNVKNTEFEQYFDPFEGVTDQQLHNYFLKKVMTGKEKKISNAALQDKHNVIDIAVSEADKSIDVLHLLSNEEKRQKLQKVLNDLKSKPFLQEKSLRKVENICKTVAFGTKQSDRYLKTLSTKEILTKQVMVPLLDQTKIMDRTKEYDEEFHIMFSDISTEEEEDEEEQKEEVVVNERKVEKNKGNTKQISFKTTFGIAMKHVKYSSKSESGTKTGMQRLLKHYKRKQLEDAHRKREFVRWFGESSTKDYKQQERAEVPGWKPGWHKLDFHLNDGMLKNGRDGNLRLKKGHENDPIEEYRRLLKEYEQLEGKVQLIEDKSDKQSRDQNIHKGEKWIKIKKGTLMKNYQIRWRQGMYYLVERKHIKKKTKQMLSKKRMIRASSDISRDGKKRVDKNTGKLNMKRSLAKKKGSKMVKRKSFRKRGEAAKEIRRILSCLASKHVDEGDEDLIDKNKMKLKWTTTKFNDYFKKKCQEFGLGVSTTEQNNIRKSFSNYCLQYFVTKLQRRETQLKNQQEDMYPLGLFKPKELINGDLEHILEKELSDESDTACSDEDEIFNEALIKELFSFWTTDLQTSERYDDELQIFKTRRGKPNRESVKEILGEQVRFQTESPKKTSRNNSTIKNEAEKLPQHHCKVLFDLSPDLRDRFFGSEASVSKTQLKIPFGDKYLTKDKSYLVDKSTQSASAKYSDVISEMKQEGLIEIVDYQFLKDDEAIFPWDEIEIVPMEYPAYKEYIYKKEEQPSLIKDENVYEGEDSWPESDDLGLF